MSYEIVYDKQFIKVNDKGTEKYIPMILAGASNCYDTNYNGKERRERSWFSWHNTSLISTVAEMVGYWDNVRTEKIVANNKEDKDKWYTEYNDNAFGYWVGIGLGSKHTSNVSFKNITGIFTVGAKKSLTIEQLASEGVRVIVKSSYILNNDVNISPYSLVVENDTELFDAIEQCNKRFEGTKVRATIKFGAMYEDKPKRLRARYFAPIKRVKVAKEFKTTYRIAVDNYGFFQKETRSNMVYNMTGKIFVSKNAVDKKLKQLNDKNYSCKFTIETNNKPITVAV